METTSKTFGVFLCNLKDSPDPTPLSREKYVEAFLTGAESLNQYWKDNSVGKLNIDGSQIFGWLQINMTVEEFREAIILRDPKNNDKVTMKDGNGNVIGFQRSRASAIRIMQGQFNITQNDNKYEYLGNSFDYIIGIFADDIDDGGNAESIIAGNSIYSKQGIASHTFWAHEMAHAMFDSQRVHHSFSLATSSAGTEVATLYDNQSDIMSAESVWSSNHDILLDCGPNMCSVYREALGWIPQQRIAEINIGNRISTELEIVSRSHPETNGLELIKIPAYGLYIEFVTKEKWDRGVPVSGIVFNEKRDVEWGVVPKKYLGAFSWMKAEGNPDTQIWKAGDKFEKPKSHGLSAKAIELLFTGYLTIEILSVNERTKKAKLRITYTPPKNHWRPSLFGYLWGGADVDGGGGIIVNGKYKPIPPRGIRRLLTKAMLAVSSLFVKIANVLAGEASIRQSINSNDNKAQIK